MKLYDRVRINDDVFENSDDPTDQEIRGKVGVIVYINGDEIEVELDDEKFILLLVEEVTLITDLAQSSAAS
jgi:hypothetical protein